MISLFTFKTLGTRFLILLLIPVCILLTVGGTASFMYTRNAMLAQWNEGAILKLERAAHFMEMRLTAPLKMLDSLFQARASLSPLEVLTALYAQKGVLYAEYKHIGTPPRFGHGNMMQRRMHFQRSGITGISKPSYNADVGRETLTVTVNLWDDTQSPVSTLNIIMSFEYLLGDMVRLSWWQSNMACIVDKDGRYLAHTNMQMADRKHLGGDGDPLEASILDRMKEQTYGTVKSEGHPPKLIAGFYKLKHAPWTIVIYARGKTVLEPIIKYRNGFVLGIVVISCLILVLIRHQTGKLTRAVRVLSDRAEKVAKGEYGTPIQIQGKDEISRLVNSFNDMVRGLEERDFIRNSFGRYVDPEFARRLLAGFEAATLGGGRREVAILMSDIRDFTSLSERLSPEKTIQLLNLYFSRMINIIQDHGGIIVDFFGDAILVFFDSLGQSAVDSTHRAFACASQMQADMAAFNMQMSDQGLPRLGMGIGLHSGPVIVGNIGSASRTKYGIVGSAVNLTARIQARARQGEIWASESAIEKLAGRVDILASHATHLKGIKHSVTLYNVAGKHGEEKYAKINKV